MDGWIDEIWMYGWIDIGLDIGLDVNIGAFLFLAGFVYFLVLRG